MKKEKY